MAVAVQTDVRFWPILAALTVLPWNDAIAQDLFIQVNDRNFGDVARIAAEFGEPRTIDIPAGVQPIVAIASVCPASRDYLSLLIDNIDLTITVEEFGSDVRSINGDELFRAMDVKTSIEVPACISAPVLATSASDGAAAEWWSSIPIADGQSELLMLSLEDYNAQGSVLTNEFDIVSESAFLVAPPPEINCSRIPPGANWPFNVERILFQLALSRTWFNSNYQTATILILDSGLDVDLMPDDWPSDAVSKLRGLENNVTGTEGVNLATMTNGAATPPDYAYRWHGLSVSEVALGTHLTHPYRSIVDDLPQIAFASNLEITENGPRISATALANAYDFSDRRGVSIVNASFLINGNMAALEAELKRTGDDILLVVAAGNDGERLRDYRSWPAFLGGETINGKGSAVITVGAHEPDGLRSGFSRWDPQYVDLLAPGCEIPSVGVVSHDDQTKVVSSITGGTSFAAPIVSFASGLLHGFGMDPFEIKNRINISADVSNELDGDVFSRGILNIEDALAFPFVVVRTQNGEVTQRQLANVERFLPDAILCGASIALVDVAKVSRRQNPDGTTMLHIWERAIAPAGPRNTYCQMEDDDRLELDLSSMFDDGTIHITLENLYDIIFDG